MRNQMSPLFDSNANQIMVGDRVHFNGGGGQVTAIYGNLISVFIANGAAMGEYADWEGIERFLPNQLKIVVRRCGHSPTSDKCTANDCRWFNPPAEQQPAAPDTGEAAVENGETTIERP